MPKWAIFLDQFWAFIIYMLVSGFLFGAFSQVYTLITIIITTVRINYAEKLHQS
jgi:hypothetical protein